MPSLIGKVLDNYQILEVLGKGGMGIVYKALDQALEKVVAVKMIDASFIQDEIFLRRFRSEAKALAKLENPNIVSIFALRDTDSGLLMVMEYVDGQTLADKLRERGAIRYPEATQIISQLLSALDHAHGAGVIHRDIKPGNVMINTRGLVKVTDFGLARLHGSESTLASSAGTAGTFKYMAPEQVKGLPQIDHRADLYAVGITFYEMLTGRNPLEGLSTEYGILKAIVDKKFQPPNELNPEIPKPLTKIIMKAIAKEPGDRFQSAAEIMRALPVFDNDKTLVAFPAKAGSIPIKETSRPGKRAALPALIGAAVLVAFGSAYFIFPQFRSAAPPKTMTPAQGTLSLNSQPAGAEVYANGKLLGATPLSNLALDAGTLSLRLQKQDYLNLDTNVVLTADAPIVLSLSLAPATATVVIAVQPGTAEVRVDGHLLEASQFSDLQLRPGAYEITISGEGYQLKQERLTLAAGAKLTRYFELEKLEKPRPPESKGGFSLTSEPAGATIIVNGKNRGTTPQNLSGLAAGNHSIVLKKSGFSDYSTSVILADGVRTNVAATLIALTGRLNVRVSPWGSIYIDGKLHKENYDIQYQTQLTAGRHQLRVVHPALGVWEKSFELKPEEVLSFPIDFNKQAALIVTSFDEAGAALWAEIVVDEKPTGKVTPKQISLHIGQHRLAVQREGYELIGPTQVINLESDMPTPVKFVLRKEP